MGDASISKSVSRRSRILVALIGALAISLVLTASALANAFTQVYNSYRKTGHVAPCTFSEQTLRQANGQVPPDIEQYAPDFPAALQAALQARARGACGGPSGASPSSAAASSTGTPAPPSGGGAAAGPSVPSTPGAAPASGPSAATEAGHSVLPLTLASHSSSGSGGVPAAIIALAVLAGLLALALGVYGLARWRGWDPPWLRYLSHSFSEAGFHAEATWAEFADWVRLGR